MLRGCEDSQTHHASWLVLLLLPAICSVTKQEIVDAIYQQTGRSIADYELEIPDIKSLGTFECSVKLHPEVTGTFNVLIQREKNVQAKKK
jgi:large subunit ribosomal protein L9